MTSQRRSRGVDLLAALTMVYVMHVILFYGLSVRQVAELRATLPTWAHWALWGSSFLLVGLLYGLHALELRREQSLSVMDHVPEDHL